MTHPLDRKLVVEFIGMFIFVFTVGMATNKAGAGPLAPLAIGSVLMVLVFAGGHVSGGSFQSSCEHRGVRSRTDAPTEYVAYMITQFIAAVLAGLAVRVVGGHETATPVASAGKMLIAEFLFTFALGWVVLNVATARGTEGNSSTGLRSGSRWSPGRSRSAASPAALQPGHRLGAMVSGLLKWSNIWIYLLAEFLGGAAAAYAFLYVQPGEKTAGDIAAASTD